MVSIKDLIKHHVLRIHLFIYWSNYRPVSPRGFSARRARELISLAGGTSFSTAISRYRIARLVHSFGFYEESSSQFGERMHEHARACSRVLTIFRRPICFDCLNRARSSRSGCFRPDFFPLAPLGSSRPSSCHFLPLSPSPLSFFSTTSASFYASPLHRSFPPFLSSPSLLRNVHQLFLSFHISSPFIFFVCKPGIPDRRECSRLCNGDRTHGPERRTGHEGRRDEREARKGRHPCIEGSHIGEFDATRIQLRGFIYSPRWLCVNH